MTGLPAFQAIETARTQAAVGAADLQAPDLLPLLEVHAAAAPLHEPLQVRVIRLLTAAGRRAEALSHFEAVRRRLADDLGTDPGLELRAAGRPSKPSAGRNSVLGRAAQPHEIAEAVAFLASPRASYLTGATLAVDGGRTIL